MPSSRSSSATLARTISRQSKERAPDAPAVARRVLEVVAEVRRVDQQLLRDAAAMHAGAAEAVVLDNACARAVACRAAGAGHTARAAADHQKVEFRHRFLSLNPQLPGVRSARLATRLSALIFSLVQQKNYIVKSMKY